MSGIVSCAAIRDGKHSDDFAHRRAATCSRSDPPLLLGIAEQSR